MPQTQRAVRTPPRILELSRLGQVLVDAAFSAFATAPSGHATPRSRRNPARSTVRSAAPPVSRASSTALKKARCPSWTRGDERPDRAHWPTCSAWLPRGGRHIGVAATMIRCEDLGPVGHLDRVDEQRPTVRPLVRRRDGLAQRAEHNPQRWNHACRAELVDREPVPDQRNHDQRKNMLMPNAA